MRTAVARRQDVRVSHARAIGIAPEVEDLLADRSGIATPPPLPDRAIVASGTPHEVCTSTTIAAVFDLDARIIPDPETGTPMVIPHRR